MIILNKFASMFCFSKMIYTLNKFTVSVGTIIYFKNVLSLEFGGAFGMDCCGTMQQIFCIQLDTDV